MEDIYYKPNEIIFTKVQVLWLLQHLAEFAPDGWPPECKETGYIGSKTTRRHRAPFESPAGIWGELRERIEKAGQDGLWLEIAYCRSNYTVQEEARHIANALRLDQRTIERRVESALKYVCGKTRKRRSYKQFRHHR